MLALINVAFSSNEKVLKNVTGDKLGFKRLKKYCNNKTSPLAQTFTVVLGNFNSVNLFVQAGQD